MALTIYLTKDFDQMSQVAAQLVEDDIKEKQIQKSEYILGLATGNSPSGLYKHLAKAFNSRRIDATKIRSFNLDEYIGLPGENAQQRVLNKESFSFFMISELFGLLQYKFIETNVPGGVLIDQKELVKVLEDCKDQYELQGTDKGKAIIINEKATGLLKTIKEDIIDGYAQKIFNTGGIDLQIIGVGGRGHVAFHESGIPFEGNEVLLVKLDDNTINNAVEDGHFVSKEESPCYTISMGVELVFKSKKVVLVANGLRKNKPISEAILGPVTCEVPISYGQKYSESGGEMIFVLDQDASRDILDKKDEIENKGYTIIDKRADSYQKVSSISFTRNPDANSMC